MSRTGLLMPPPNKPKRNDRAVKIARDLAIKAKLVAGANGVTVAEYLSGLIRADVERDFQKAVKNIQPGQNP